MREQFIKFFTKREFIHLPHSSLVCYNETTLFTVAGMKQFTSWFKDVSIAPYKNVVTVQPCLRIAGKHDDLNNIGRTERHNTLFEMLGIFSFGQLTKRNTIEYMWEFITQHIDAAYLYVTIYKKDDEAYDIWASIIDPQRIARAEMDTNFWSAGSVGLCGPCSEIFFDKYKTPLKVPYSQIYLEDRFLEIANMVFMSYDKQHADQTEEEMVKLPCVCIDVGAGLERIESVLNGTYDNYSVSTLLPIVRQIGLDHTASRVIADHMRSIVFMVHENINPSGKDHGHVLRRLIRRILTYYINDATFKIDMPDMSSLVFTTINCLSYYTELKDTPTRVLKILKDEQVQLQHVLDSCSSHMENMNENKIVYLHNTYGLPISVALTYCQKFGVHINEEEVMRLSALHNNITSFQLPSQQNTTKRCYETLSCEAQVVELFDINRSRVEYLKQEGYVVLNQSCFYPLGGGQMGDMGQIISDHSVFEVTDTRIQKPTASIHTIIHFVKPVSGILYEGDKVKAVVNAEIRIGRARAHTATHILCDYLYNKYHVKQAGSKVDTNSFTFDVETSTRFNDKHLEIEKYVNDIIKNNLPVQLTHHNKEEVKHLMQLNAVYDPVVRVISINGVSQQLCGGTHVENTGEIISFKILSETSIKSGVRRFTCAVGQMQKVDKVEIINNIITHTVGNSACIQCDINIRDVFKQNMRQYERLIVYMYTNKGTQMRMKLPNTIAQQIFNTYKCEGVVNHNKDIHDMGSTFVINYTDLTKFLTPSDL